MTITAAQEPRGIHQDRVVFAGLLFATVAVQRDKSAGASTG
jgi:hypothetical protein